MPSTLLREGLWFLLSALQRVCLSKLVLMIHISEGESQTVSTCFTLLGVIPKKFFNKTSELIGSGEVPGEIFILSPKNCV